MNDTALLPFERQNHAVLEGIALFQLIKFGQDPGLLAINEVHPFRGVDRLWQSQLNATTMVVNLDLNPSGTG